MKFKKDKEHPWISTSDSFKVTWINHDRVEPIEFTEIVRLEVDNYRGFSAYDSPKCYNRYSQYVKANYVLSLNYQTTLTGYTTSNGERVPAKKAWVCWCEEEWSFETKKEMMEFLNKYMDCMAKGEKADNGYVNRYGFKITKGVK